MHPVKHLFEDIYRNYWGHLASYRAPGTAAADQACQAQARPAAGTPAGLSLE